jgi:hypothetical protein
VANPWPCKVEGCDRGDDNPFTRIADLRAHSKEVHGEDLSPRKGSVAPSLDGDNAPDEPGPREIAPVEAPAPEKKSLRERARALVEPKDKPDRLPAKRGPKAKSRGARISLARGASGLWKRAGTMLVMSGVDVPVGRALVYQSPRAGDMIDHLVADTWVDKAVQPLARKGEAIAELGSLIMLPVLVGAYERNPSPMIEQLLREVMREHLQAMVPLIKAQREEEAKHAALVRDMGLDPGDDAIGAVLREMFGPVEGPAGSGGAEASNASFGGEAEPPGPNGERVTGGVTYGAP